MARGGENEFRDACHEVRKVAGGLWDVPRQRTALLAAVLDAELRIMSDKEAKRLNTSFQELLSSLDVAVPETLDWWLRYLRFAQRAGALGCSGVPSVSEVHWRALRVLPDQALYREKSQQVMQSQA